MQLSVSTAVALSTLSNKSAAAKGKSEQNGPLLALNEQLNSSSKRKSSSIGSTKVVTRRDYMSIITLKLGGRSHEEIAEKFGLPLDKVRGHIERAMSEDPKGAIKPQPGAVAGEAKKKGEDKSTEFVQDLNKAYDEAVPALERNSAGGNIRNFASNEAEVVQLNLPTIASETAAVQPVEVMSEFSTGSTEAAPQPTFTAEA